MLRLILLIYSSFTFPGPKRKMKNLCTQTFGRKHLMEFASFYFFLQDDGWKLNRTNYYQEGWLATGNIRGIVGVTFTTSHCKKNMDYPLRTNYNLRGHRSDVSTYIHALLYDMYTFLDERV